MRDTLEALDAGRSASEAESRLAGYATTAAAGFDDAARETTRHPRGDPRRKTPAEVAALTTTAVETTGRARSSRAGGRGRRPRSGRRSQRAPTPTTN